MAAKKRRYDDEFDDRRDRTRSKGHDKGRRRDRSETLTYELSSVSDVWDTLRKDMGMEPAKPARKEKEPVKREPKPENPKVVTIGGIRPEDVTAGDGRMWVAIPCSVATDGRARVAVDERNIVPDRYHEGKQAIKMGRGRDVAVTMLLDDAGAEKVREAGARQMMRGLAANGTSAYMMQLAPEHLKTWRQEQLAAQHSKREKDAERVSASVEEQMGEESEVTAP